MTAPRHSADVRMELRLNGHVIPIAQLGPRDLITRQPIDHPPADGEIVLSIDGSETRCPVRLTEGLCVGRSVTAVRFLLPKVVAIPASDLK